MCLPAVANRGKTRVHMWSEFGEYIPETEPEGVERLYVWQMAVGLQAVDGLKPSDFLLQTARRNIAGDIGIDEVRRLVYEYYENRELRTEQERTEHEADKVAANMAKILGERSFSLVPGMVVSIHQRLFDGVFPFAGQFRKVDISKKEWVLRGDTVLYSPAPLIEESVHWDIAQERNFNYVSLSLSQAVEHLAHFIAALWQIHPFAEGNTRTMAVLLIKYLRYMGFDADYTLFARHSWYFRNALVRANYHNPKKGVDKDFKYLVNFLRNLLMGETHELKNRYLIIPDVEQAAAATEQVTEQVRGEKLIAQFSNQLQILIKGMEEQEYSMKQLMALCSIKHRPSFIENYIKPAISNGIVKLKYEDNPNHPRQKYLLTIKGVLLRNS